MKRLMLVVALAAFGCDGTGKFELDGAVDVADDVVADTTDDTTPDMAPDITPDTGLDTAPDTTADVGYDTGLDTAPDTTPDVGFDTAPDTTADVGYDTGFDTAPDSTGCITTADCMMGLECCGGRCVNLMHDPDHCSACYTPCPEARPFCSVGSCADTPCFGVTCIGTETCCGNNCCALGTICCQVDGPGPTGGPDCYVGECPGGCPLCG